MNEAKWEKLAASTGIAALVLFGVGYALTGNPPAADSTGEEILIWATDERGAIMASSYLGGVGSVLLLWFFGSLRSYLRSAEGRTGRLSAVAFGAGLVVVTVFGVSAALSAVLALRPEGTLPAVAQALFDGTNVFYSMSWFPSAALVGAVSVITMRARAFPAWFGLAGYAVMILFLVAGIGISATTGPLAAGKLVQVLAYAGWALWFLLGGILLIQRVGRD